MADLKAYESAEMSEGKKAVCLEIESVVGMANMSVAEKVLGAVACSESRKAYCSVV